MRSLKSRLLFATLVLAACSDDDAPVQRDLDGGQHDASIDAQIQDAKTDASSDASLDAGSCSLDQTYKFYSDGGLMSFRDSLIVTAAGKVTLHRQDEAVDAGSALDCTYDLPACQSDQVDAFDLSAALSDPSVIAAFSSQEHVYGEDSRPVDGSIAVIERADGKKIWIGGGCEGQTCTIPAPILALRTVAGKLQAQYHPQLGASCTP